MPAREVPPVLGLHNKFGFDPATGKPTGGWTFDQTTGKWTDPDGKTPEAYLEGAPAPSEDPDNELTLGSGAGFYYARSGEGLTAIDVTSLVTSPWAPVGKVMLTFSGRVCTIAGEVTSTRKIDTTQRNQRPQYSMAIDTAGLPILDLTNIADPTNPGSFLDMSPIVNMPWKATETWCDVDLKGSAGQGPLMMLKFDGIITGRIADYIPEMFDTRGAHNEKHAKVNHGSVDGNTFHRVGIERFRADGNNIFASQNDNGRKEGNVPIFSASGSDWRDAFFKHMAPGAALIHTWKPDNSHYRMEAHGGQGYSHQGGEGAYTSARGYAYDHVVGTRREPNKGNDLWIRTHFGDHDRLPLNFSWMRKV